VNCESTPAHLDDYLDGALSAPQRQAFETHVAACAACRDKLAAARALQSALAAYPPAPPRDGFEARVLGRAAGQRPARAPRVVAMAFVAAFAASILTVIFTGLLVRAPHPEFAAGLPTVAMVVDQTRDVNLVFASSAAVDSVSMHIVLPAGIEMLGHEGEREVRWRTQLAAGNNILPLKLVASGPATGQLVARLQHGDREKVFRVHLTASSG
jgi:anti-sigma factor RsiW